MKDIFELEEQTVIDRGSSYILSYPHIASYFSGLQDLTEQDVIRGAHMVYGWMPTVLDLHVGDAGRNLVEVTELLNSAKSRGELVQSDFSVLAGLINHSLVGASKLLHFVAPERFAIWDSRIYAFMYEKKPSHSRVNKVVLYSTYLETLKNLSERNEFEHFHQNVNRKMGYRVTPMRAAEIIMFLNSPMIAA
jgi:hypothetical protein